MKDELQKESPTGGPSDAQQAPRGDGEKGPDSKEEKKAPETGRLLELVKAGEAKEQEHGIGSRFAADEPDADVSGVEGRNTKSAVSEGLGGEGNEGIAGVTGDVGDAGNDGDAREEEEADDEGDKSEADDAGGDPGDGSGVVSAGDEGEIDEKREAGKTAGSGDVGDGGAAGDKSKESEEGDAGDTGHVGAVGDAGETANAANIANVSDVADAADAAGAADIADAADAMDAANAMDVADAADAMDAVDAANAADAMDAADAMGAADVVDAADNADAADKRDEEDDAREEDEANAAGAVDEEDEENATDAADEEDEEDETDAADEEDEVNITDAANAADATNAVNSANAADAADAADTAEAADAFAKLGESSDADGEDMRDANGTNNAEGDSDTGDRSGGDSAKGNGRGLNDDDAMEGVTTPAVQGASAEATEVVPKEGAKGLQLHAEEEGGPSPVADMGQIEITVLVGPQGKMSDAEKPTDGIGKGGHLPGDDAMEVGDEPVPMEIDGKGSEIGKTFSSSVAGDAVPSDSAIASGADISEEQPTGAQFAAHLPSPTIDKSEGTGSEALTAAEAAMPSSVENGVSAAKGATASIEVTGMSVAAPMDAPQGADISPSNSGLASASRDGTSAPFAAEIPAVSDPNIVPGSSGQDGEGTGILSGINSAAPSSIGVQHGNGASSDAAPDTPSLSPQYGNGQRKQDASPSAANLKHEVAEDGLDGSESQPNSESHHQKKLAPLPPQDVFQPRSLRPRSGPAPAAVSDPMPKNDGKPAPQVATQASPSSTAKPASRNASRTAPKLSSRSVGRSMGTPAAGASKGTNAQTARRSGTETLRIDPSAKPDTPDGPERDADGLYMKIGESLFLTIDQLSAVKRSRLSEKLLVPIEDLKFSEVRTYNRDQLRAYCFVYGLPRRKKTEMEADMARYVSLWNRGRPGYQLHEYVPTSSRGGADPSESTSEIGSRYGKNSSVGSSGRRASPNPSGSGALGQDSSGKQGTPPRGSNSGKNTSAKGSAHGAAPSDNQNATGSAAGAGPSTARQSTSAAAKAARPSAAVLPLPRGYGTSFKQKTHAKQAGAKYKAAYNGAGPAIVNIVENAAAYFEGKDSPEVLLDKAKSYERYQFNVDLLAEIFDGPLPTEAQPDVEMTTDGNEDCTNGAENETNMAKSIESKVMQDVSHRMLTKRKADNDAELAELVLHYQELEDETKHVERTNMRLFQRLERAETRDEVEAVKADIEREYNIHIEENHPPIVRRKLDKSLPMTVMSDEQCHILRFKVS